MKEVITLFLWILLWATGGYLLGVGVFRLPYRERLPVGVGLGLIVQLWLANLLAHRLPLLWASWLAALGTLGWGVWCARTALRQRRWQQLAFPLSQAILLALIGWWMFSVGRGLAIFDDYQNVPTVSLMATGEVPPRFALDPRLRFGYHYLLLLFAAQVMRLGDVFPWNALDLVRGLALALTVLLAAVWMWRMTRSRLAAFLGSVFFTFLSGARWVLLLLPASWVQWLSGQVTLIGSGAETAGSLAEALARGWNISGHGPIPFPFAYISGLKYPLILGHGGVGVMGSLLPLLLLLTYRRWRDRHGGVLLTIVLAAWALVEETPFLALLPTFALGVLLYARWKRQWAFPRGARRWVGVLLGALVLALFQGGVLTEMAREAFLRWMGGPAREAYHTFHFVLQWPPYVVSPHLGILTLTRPGHLFLAFLEIGVFILAFPLTLIWGWKMLRAQRWWEVIFVGSAWAGALATVFHYTGTAGISANTRLFARLYAPVALYAFPLTWVWARRRGEALQTTLAALALISVFGGMVTFGIELIATRQPQLPTFIQILDARMMGRYWNRLEPDALVFDLRPVRAVTVFGRYTDSHETWYQAKAAWQALAAEPTPATLRAAGFDYFYVTREEWESLSPTVREAWQADCVRLVDEVTGPRNEHTSVQTFRRLYDIRACP